MLDLGVLELRHLLLIQLDFNYFCFQKGARHALGHGLVDGRVPGRRRGLPQLPEALVWVKLLVVLVIVRLTLIRRDLAVGDWPSIDLEMLEPELFDELLVVIGVLIDN